MTDWIGTTLGEMCSFRAGMVFKREEQGADSGDVPFIKVSDMNLSQNEIAIREANNWVDDDFIARHRAKPFPVGTVVFAKIGEALKQNRVRRLVRPTLIDNNMMGALANQKIVTPEFLYYRLAAFDIASTATGTALPYLTVSVLQRQEFLIPPIKQQRRIASILSAYDDLIENNTRRIAILEEMARRIYEEWFVRFRYPGHEGVRMVESELGSVPEGWQVRKLEDVATITMGLSPKGDTYNDVGDGVPLVNGPVEFGDRLTKRVKWTTSPTKLCAEGDLVVCVRGSTTGKYVKSDGRYCLGRGVCALRSTYQSFIDQFFIHALPSLLAQTGGSTFPSWTGPQLKSHRLLVPAKDLLAKFEDAAQSMNRAVLAYSRMSQNLRTTRDLLLPKLISGELDVSELPFPEAVTA